MAEEKGGEERERRERVSYPIWVIASGEEERYHLRLLLLHSVLLCLVFLYFNVCYSKQETRRYEASREKREGEEMPRHCRGLQQKKIIFFELNFFQVSSLSSSSLFCPLKASQVKGKRGMEDERRDENDRVVKEWWGSRDVRTRRREARGRRGRRRLEKRFLAPVTPAFECKIT